MIGGYAGKKGQPFPLVEEKDFTRQRPIRISVTLELSDHDQSMMFSSANHALKKRNIHRASVENALARGAQEKRRAMNRLAKIEPSEIIPLDSLSPINSNEDNIITATEFLSESPGCVPKQVDSAECQTKASYRQKMGQILDQAWRKISGGEEQVFHKSSKNRVVMEQAPISYTGMLPIDSSLGGVNQKQLRQQRSIECALVGLNKLFVTDSDGVFNIQKFKEWIQKQDVESVAKLKKNADASGFMRSFTTALKLGTTLLKEKETNFPQDERQEALVKIAEFYRDNQKKLVPLGDKNTYSEEFFKSLANDKNNINEIMTLIRNAVELFRPFSQAEDIDGALPEKEEIDAIWLRMDINPLSFAERIWLEVTPGRSSSFRHRKDTPRRPITRSHSLRC
ncbi:Putative uncharacterized protein [Mycoavidus cysteinexigens]|uniref:Uncharacterized protein n=2 Tax=Mycoavidus cysteinexigens TaxID=1553431 RepID=A0A2Z6EWT6_9BURK|nr:hypothetical protein [Mycoavidus cysteinexigens]BBE09917.1 Putative uncharacterized protein [Mycoavidus cysteinexigens]GAM53738.1 hypothetical protein EBME_2201 [bacterium endosymbiont of Mortierella elongata FMR23-6]GLR00357.1 hypothetical protein GCM10007934_01680 [Mycoavidus cysteinexigens]